MELKFFNKGVAPLKAEKKVPVYKFIDKTFTLYRNTLKSTDPDGRLKESNKTLKELKFRVDPSLSKPEVKQILQKMYNLNIQTVRSQVRMGQFKFDLDNNFSRIIRKIQTRRLQTRLC